MDKGYSVINAGNKSLLVLKSELDDQLKARAIADFLGLDGLQIVRSNVSRKRGYAKQYEEFKQRVQIPVSLLDEMYESKFARFFYSEEQRMQFRRRWSRSETPV